MSDSGMKSQANREGQTCTTYAASMWLALENLRTSYSSRALLRLPTSEGDFEIRGANFATVKGIIHLTEARPYGDRPIALLRKALRWTWSDWRRCQLSPEVLRRSPATQGSIPLLRGTFAGQHPAAANRSPLAFDICDWAARHTAQGSPPLLRLCGLSRSLFCKTEAWVTPPIKRQYLQGREG